MGNKGHFIKDNNEYFIVVFLMYLCGYSALFIYGME